MCLYARERVQTTNYGKANMKKLNRLVLMAAVAALLALSGSKVLAQGRGNFDPEQMRQRMLERYKERLEVKSDDEWKIISERIEKVMTAQRDARMGGFGGGRRGGHTLHVRASQRTNRQSVMVDRDRDSRCDVDQRDGADCYDQRRLQLRRRESAHRPLHRLRVRSALHGYTVHYKRLRV